MLKFKGIAIMLITSMLAGMAVLPVSAEESYNPAAGEWKFDFGGGTVETDYIGVSADTKFTDSLEYGFIGTGENDYKFKNGAYMDSFSTVQGQKIELTDGTSSKSGADGDFVAAVKGTAVTEPSDFYDYTTQNPIRFSMTVENGGYYHVKVTLANSSSTDTAKVSLFAERRHQLLTDAEIAAGEILTYEFNVDVENVYFKSLGAAFADNSISIEVTGVNAAISSMEVTKAATNGTTLWLMGDSTGCDQNCGFPYFPLQNYAGTGQGLTKYLPADIALSNQGDGGINSGDKNHYKQVKLKSGDYLYAEWGHNEISTDNYVSNMEKYYVDTVKAGAKLVVVGPIDRSSSSQFNSETGKWSSTLSDYSEAGKSFVNKVLTDADYVKSLLGDDYSNYTADDLNNIAFVDINAGWLEFLNQQTERYKTVMNKDGYDFQSVKFYYKSDKSGLVENSHENDAGADNAAYIFFTEAKKKVDAAKDTGASDADKAQAAVLEGLVTNMRENTPYTAPETILKGGDVINKSLTNVYYPAVVTATHDGAAATVKKVNIEDGKIVSATVKMEYSSDLSAKGVTYALAVAEVDGSKTSSTLDTKYDVTNGNGTFELVFAEPITLPQSGEYTVWLQGLDDDTQAVYEGDEYCFSNKFTQNDVSDVDEYLMGDYDDIEIPDTFSYFGVKTASSINAQNGWTEYGSAVKSSTLEADAENAEYPTYLKIANTGFYDKDVTSTKGSYYLYKAFSSTVSDGKIVLDTDLYYESGVLSFYYSDGARATDADKAVKLFELSNNKLTNGDISFDLTANTWTHITYTLDYDNGTAAIKVGNAAAQTYNIDSLQTCLANSYQPISLGSLALVGTTGTAANIRLANLSVKKMVSDTMADKTVSVSAQTGGTVSIKNKSENSVTVPMNSSVIITAMPDEGYTFSKWIDADGNTLSSDAELELRAHTDLTLTAVFADEAVLFSEDFEGATHTFKPTTNANEFWGTDTAQKNALSSKVYGVKASRGAYWIADSDTSITGKVKLSMKFRIDATAKNGTVELFISDDCTPDKNSSSADKKIIDIKATSGDTNMTLGTVTLNNNDLSNKAIVVGELSENVNNTRNGTGWLNMSALLDFKTKKADMTLTRISDNSEVYKAEGVDFESADATKLGAIALNNSGGYGGAFVDDILIEQVREETPNIEIDYEREKLTGFTANATYTIDGAAITPETTEIDAADYIDKTVSIKKCGEENYTLDSLPQSLEIPVRPDAPTESDYSVTQPTTDEETGSVTAQNGASLQYSADGQNWGDIPSTIAQGTMFYLRKKAVVAVAAEGGNEAVAGAFASAATEVITIDTIRKVTFNTDGGGTIDPVYVKDGETVSAPSTNPTKEGYTFSKWQLNNSDYNFDTAVTANIELKAVWTQNKYTVTWKNGEATLETDTEVVHGSAPSYNGVEPTKASTNTTVYTFSGWKIDGGDNTLITDLTGQTITANTTYLAQFTESVRKYKIKFVDADGSTVLKDETEYEYSATVTQPETTPTKAATDEYTYTFAGWNPGVTTVTGDQTYTATYTQTARTYTVAYTTNDGTIENEESYTKYTYGIGLTLPTPTKNGYTFKGWYVNNDFLGDAVTAITTTETGDKTYYAKWEQNAAGTVTVSFNADGGTLEGNSSKAVTSGGQLATADIPTASKIGFTFSGWKNGENTYSAEQLAALTISTDMTFTATYTPIDYTITASAENGTITVTESKQTAHYGETVTFTITPATGYQLKANSVQVNSGAVTVTESNGTYSFNMPAANVIITAEFEQITYILTKTASENGSYTITGADFGGGDTAMVAHGTEITIMPSADLNYELDKVYAYATNGEKTELADNNGYKFTMMKDTTVEVTFKLVTTPLPTTYTVTFKIDGQEDTEVEVEHGATAQSQAPQIQTKEGYHFVGWVKGTDTTQDVVTEWDIITENGIVYTAKFEEDVPTPTYLDVLDAFKDILTIEKITNTEGITLVIAPKEGQTLPPLTMYKATYYASGTTLVSVEMPEIKTDTDGKRTITLDKPDSAPTGLSYKLFLWADNMSPVINVIDSTIFD